MKHNVFFVDDEVIIRDGFRNLINASNTFSVCGEAADGEMALTLMQDLKPDILITDIKMPFMDGLELARIVKKTMPWIHIIMLSGHDEFEYARKSISIGVDEFLLKPICSSDIIKALNKSVEIIESERAREVNKHKLDEQIKSVSALVRNQMLDELITGSINTSETIKRAEQLDIALFASHYLTMLVEMPISSDSSNSNSSNKFLSARSLLENILSEYSEVIHFYQSSDRLVLIVKGSEPDAMNETAYILARAITLSLLKKLDYIVYVGIGGIVRRISEISVSYSQAQKACKHIHFVKSTQIASIDDISPQEASINFESLANASIYEKLKYTKIKDAQKLATDYLKDIDETGKTSLLFSNYIIIDILVSATRYVKELGGNPKEILPPLADEKHILSIYDGKAENLNKIILEIIANTLAYRDKCASSKHANTIKKAQEYMKSHFQNASISLNTVAKEVSISPNYFSTIFSQETGETFIEYLTSLRMKKSVELLNDTKMNLADIAFAVGYSEPHYFSYLFKKYWGQSPGSFRNKQKEKG